MSDQAISYRAVLDQLYDGVYFVDCGRAIQYWNRGAERISGFTADEVLGTRCSQNILMHVSEDGRQLCLEGCPLSATMQDGTAREAEVYLHHKDGHRVPVLVRTAPLRDSDDRIVGGVEVFSDNRRQAALRREVEELSKLALLDQLTGVGNRRYGEMTLQSRQDELERYGWPFGVLLVDIDHFKRFNDQYGHDVGDVVLHTVAQTLSSNTRSFDTAARWGGDEFIVVIEKVEIGDLRTRAEMLCRLVAASSVAVKDQGLSVTVSVGGSVARAGDSWQAAIKRADELLYQGKAAGRDRAVFE